MNAINTIGRTVLRIRKALEMTQGQLAEASGIDQADISRIERCDLRRNRITITLATVEKLAAALDTTPIELQKET